MKAKELFDRVVEKVEANKCMICGIKPSGKIMVSNADRDKWVGVICSSHTLKEILYHPKHLLVQVIQIYSD